MVQARSFTAALALITVVGGASYAETIEKKGKTATGETCSISVEKHADGRITAIGSSSTSGVAGSVSSSSSAGGSSVNVQAGGGTVSSSASTSAGPGSVSASTMTVNGCTISTSSP